MTNRAPTRFAHANTRLEFLPFVKVYRGGTGFTEICLDFSQILCGLRASVARFGWW